MADAGNTTTAIKAEQDRLCRVNPDWVAGGVSALSIHEIAALMDGLKTLYDVTMGLICQPRFQDREQDSNRAGDVLDVLSNQFFLLRDELGKHLATLKAAGDFEPNQRFWALVSRECDDMNDPATIVALAAGFVASKH